MCQFGQVCENDLSYCRKRARNDCIGYHSKYTHGDAKREGWKEEEGLVVVGERGRERRERERERETGGERE